MWWKMKNYSFVFLLAISMAIFTPANATNKDTGVGLFLRSDSHSLDVYLVNQSVDDKMIYPAIDYRGIEREIEFHFYTENGHCSSCNFRFDGETNPHRVPPSSSTKILRPNEVYGSRFKIKGIAGRYGLKPGCYGVYATYSVKYPPAGAFVGPINSNAIKLCLK
jgi:hypothetical protein